MHLQILIYRCVTEKQTQGFPLGGSCRGATDEGLWHKKITPHPSATPPPVSLRIGHAHAPTRHRRVIHYPRATSLPQGEAYRLCCGDSPINSNLKLRLNGYIPIYLSPPRGREGEDAKRRGWVGVAGRSNTAKPQFPKPTSTFHLFETPDIREELSCEHTCEPLTKKDKLYLPARSLPIRLPSLHHFPPNLVDSNQPPHINSPHLTPVLRERRTNGEGSLRGRGSQKARHQRSV